MDELRRKSLEKREIDFGLGQINEIEMDLFAQRSQRVFLGEETQFDGDLVEPRALGLVVPRELQLALVEKPLSEKDFACFHRRVH